MQKFLFLILCCLCGTVADAQISKRVYRDNINRLRYITDTDQNHILDFSHAGYRNGETGLPNVPDRKTIGPVSGDDTQNIQNAINEVGRRSPDGNGFRGAVRLRPGTYNIRGTLRLPVSGVVLRGSGRGTDPGTSTILRGEGLSPARRELIIVGGQSAISWDRAIAGTRNNITSPFLPAGSRTVQVADDGDFNVGDNVIIFQPSTPDWLRSVNFGDAEDDPRWAPGEIDIFYNRRITRINRSENKITVDAPITDHLDRSLAQSQIYRFDNAGIRSRIGIENLRIDVVYEGGDNPRHVRTCILMKGVDNCWMNRVTGQNFSYALVDHQRATRVTILNCAAYRPKSPIAGGFRYNFAANKQSNSILFKNCKASQGRHAFVANGAAQSCGIVWTECEGSEDYAMSEGHRRWSQGLLYDDCTFVRNNTTFRPVMALWNRGNSGDAHGWASVNSVAWNVRVDGDEDIVVQRPPGRQNYAIGCRGRVSGNGFEDQPRGFIELTNQTPDIVSLYRAQLAQRLADGVAPDGPARLRITRNDSRTNTLNWLDIADNEKNYIIELSRNGGSSFSRLARIGRNSTRYVHRNVSNNGPSLVYRVYAEGDLPSPFSNNARGKPTNSRQTTSAPAASATLLPEFTAYPNPAREQLRLSGLPNTGFVLEVRDVQGRHLMTRRFATGTDRASLPVADLLPGPYLLVVKGENSLRTHRFIKR